MKSKIPLLLFLLAVIALLIFLYPAVKSRYFNNGSRDNKSKIIENNFSDQEATSNKNDSDARDANENNNSIEDAKAPVITVTPKDCDDECRRFKKNNELEYCQEICGTKTYFEDASEDGGDSSDCNDEKGIQKDYCLKDIAVGNKDFKICDEISDSEIKKTCKNRISEDIIENQQP